MRDERWAYKNVVCYKCHGLHNTYKRKVRFSDYAVLGTFTNMHIYLTLQCRLFYIN